MKRFSTGGFMSKKISALVPVAGHDKFLDAPINHNRTRWLSPTFHLFVLLVSLSVFRVYSLEVTSRELLDCTGCLSSQSIVFELRFLLIAVSLHLLGHLFANATFRFVIRLQICLLLLLYAVDLVLLKELHVRLTLQEFRQFSGQFTAVGGYLQQLFSNSPASVLVVIAFGTVFLRYLGYRSLLRQSPAVPLFLTSGCVLLAGYAEPVGYHLYYLQNPIEAFFETASRNKPYTPAFQPPPQKAQARAACIDGKGAQPNIILVIVESLSMYHSKLFSGMNDWTPEFDALSRKGLRFNNFHANGVSTEQGLVSLLTGEPPIEKGWKDAKNILQQFGQPSQSIPRMLNALNYQTAFLTTGDLGFLNKGTWLVDMGFSFVEGSDARYYDGLKRFTFNAATDDSLYGRSLEKLTQLQASGKAPVFMVLETVTTHAPYVDPVSGRISQELVFRYADHALGDFVRTLESGGFFENGYVMVLGDHRAMTPASSRELAAYGDRAYTRVPLAIIGHQLDARVEQGSFSQTDLLPSLQHWLGSGTQCFAQNQGVFLPTAAKAPACIFTRRSYAQNNVYAQCGSDDYPILLDGDDTRFVAPHPGPASLLQEVHALRFNQGFQPKPASAMLRPAGTAN